MNKTLNLFHVCPCFFPHVFICLYSILFNNSLFPVVESVENIWSLSLHFIISEDILINTNVSSLLCRTQEKEDLQQSLSQSHKPKNNCSQIEKKVRRLKEELGHLKFTLDENKKVKLSCTFYLTHPERFIWYPLFLGQTCCMFILEKC